MPVVRVLRKVRRKGVLMYGSFTKTRVTRSVTLAYLACALSFPASAGQQDALWMFNIRDTFLDVSCIDQEWAVIVGDRGKILLTHPTYESLWSPRDSQTKDPR